MYWSLENLKIFVHFDTCYFWICVIFLIDLTELFVSAILNECIQTESLNHTKRTNLGMIVQPLLKVNVYNFLNAFFLKKTNLSPSPNLPWKYQNE